MTLPVTALPASVRLVHRRSTRGGAEVWTGQHLGLGVSVVVHLAAADDPAAEQLAREPLRLTARELRALADGLRSPHMQAFARFHEVVASSAPQAADLEALASLADVAPPVALRAQTLLAGDTRGDRLDQRVVEALRQQGRWRTPRQLAAGAAQGGGRGLDARLQEAWLPDGRRVEFRRYPLLWRLLMVLVEQGGAASKEELVVRVWDERSYHPLRHNNRLQAAIRKLRLRLEDDPSSPGRVLTTDDGYALGGVVRGLSDA